MQHLLHLEHMTCLVDCDICNGSVRYANLHNANKFSLTAHLLLYF